MIETIIKPPVPFMNTLSKALREKAKALSKLDDAIVDKEVFENAFYELCDNVPEAKRYWDSRERHREKEHEFDTNDR